MEIIKIHDTVGAISVNWTAGIWGLLAVGLTNSDASMGAQIMGIVVIFLWTFIASLIVWSIIKAIMGIRVTEAEEAEGMDAVDIGVSAYPEFNK